MTKKFIILGMVFYGKLAAHGVSAMSFLAQNYPKDGYIAGSKHIAQARKLSQPLVAKVLTMLSQAGLVTGAPGPNGGYRLSKAPGRISLFQIVSVFENMEDKVSCPFGPSWCGRREPCPMHHSLAKLSDDVMTFLKQTHLDVFAKAQTPCTLGSM